VVEARERGRRVRLSLEVEPELHRRVKIAAATRDMTVKDYVSGILSEVVENEEIRKKKGEGEGRAEVSDEELTMPAAEGAKPRGSVRAPRPRSGRTVADAVIEDRR
jgi:hypothetical protein